MKEIFSFSIEFQKGACVPPRPIDWRASRKCQKNYHCWTVKRNNEGLPLAHLEHLASLGDPGVDRTPVFALPDFLQSLQSGEEVRIY